jgi:hypothetical protein
MSHKKLFVVHHHNAWAVKRPEAERSSALAQTQAEAIERARELEPRAVIHVQNRHGEFRQLTPFDPE